MRRLVVLLVVVLLVVAGGWLLLGGETPRSSDEVRSSASISQTVEVARERPTPRDEPTPAAKPTRAGSKQEREAMRRRILAALEARERGASGREAGSTGADEEQRAPARGATSPAEAPPKPGDLTDRTGDRGYLLKVMNEDLMPLADECYALARETQPELAGLLELDFELIGDEDIGGVVENVEPGQNNQLVNPVLIECMRESILSTTLPAPPEGGRDEIMLSLRFAPDEG